MAALVPKELPWTKKTVNNDATTKKDVIAFLQKHASFTFLGERKLLGTAKQVAKVKSKADCAKYYLELIDSQDYRKEGEIDPTKTASVAKQSTEVAAKPAASRESKKKDEQVVKENVPAADDDDGKSPVDSVAESVSKLQVDEAPKFKKRIIKKGNKIDFPKKGDNVKVYYKGMLENGTVFDTNIHAQKRGKIQPFKFKFGVGVVIRGWDEGLATMSIGEKAELVIEPEWAYGKRGREGKIPPNATLTFEMELVAIE